MPLTIHELPKQKDKVITMGKANEPVADYYPPGVTEPQVRPADVPAPEKPAEPKPAEPKPAEPKPKPEPEPEKKKTAKK
jgi:hypothetical protein